MKKLVRESLNEDFRNSDEEIESGEDEGSSLKSIKTVLGMKEYLTKKYGKDYKGSHLSDDEIDHLQDLKTKDKSGFMNFK